MSTTSPAPAPPPPDKPKATFKSTLWKHMVSEANPSPPIEPTPPTEAEEAARLEAEKKAEEAKAAEAAAQAEAEKARAAAEAEAAKKAAPSEPPKPKAKSDPLPPIEKSDFDDTPPPAPEERKPVATLLDYAPTRAEVRYLEVLQAGAEREPEKFQSILDREVDRLKKVNKFATEWQAEHPDEELSPDRPEYRRFLKAHPPAIDATEHEDLKEQLITERATVRAKQEALREMEPKLRRVAEIEAKPDIQQAQEAIEAAVLAALPESLGKDDYLVEAARDGIGALTKVPREGKVFKVALERGKEVVTEFIRLRRGLTPFDAQNPRHAFISKSIALAAEAFARDGGAERVRDGKRFVTPAEMARLRPEARAKAWTFDESDLVQSFTTMTAMGAVQELQAVRQEAEEHEKFRKPKTPVGEAPKPEPPKPPKPPTPSSPVVTPSPSSAPVPAPAVKNPNFKAALGLR